MGWFKTDGSKRHCKAEIFDGVVNGVAQIARTPFLYVWIAVFELPRLVSGKRDIQCRPVTCRETNREKLPASARIIAPIQRPRSGIVVIGDWISSIMVRMAALISSISAFSSQMSRMVCRDSRDLARHSEANGVSGSFQSCAAIFRPAVAVSVCRYFSQLSRG